MSESILHHPAARRIMKVLLISDLIFTGLGTIMTGHDLANLQYSQSIVDFYRKAQFDPPANALAPYIDAARQDKDNLPLDGATLAMGIGSAAFLLVLMNMNDTTSCNLEVIPETINLPETKTAE